MNKQTDAAIRAMNNRSSLIHGNILARMRRSDVANVRLAGDFLREALFNYECGQMAICASKLRNAAAFMTTYANELEGKD